MAFSVARLVPFLAILLHVATGCGSIVHTVGTDDAGTDSGGSGSGSGSCTGSNPGCCGLDTDGCEGIVAQATCSGDTWTCPGGDTVGPACSDICRVAQDGGGGCLGVAPECCPDDCAKPLLAPVCSSSGWTCPSGSTATNGDLCACVTDGGSGCFGGPNPGCCGFGSDGCEGIVAQASCESGEWACPSGEFVGPACSGICMATDGGSGGGGVSCGSALCDPASEYCSIFEGGAVGPDGGGAFNANCEMIPTSCVNDPAGPAAECACTLAQSHGAEGQCSESGNGFTITVEAP
jgi:hypothetical protein